MAPRAMLADTLCETVLTQHGTAYISSVNESEPKWAVLAFKNLLLGRLSLATLVVFCPEGNNSFLKRCEDI